jgi:hypothetical protein
MGVVEARLRRQTPEFQNLQSVLQLIAEDDSTNVHGAKAACAHHWRNGNPREGAPSGLGWGWRLGSIPLSGILGRLVGLAPLHSVAAHRSKEGP